MGFADWIEYFSVHGIKPDLFHVYPYYTYPTGHLFSIRKCSLESRFDFAGFSWSEWNLLLSWQKSEMVCVLSSSTCYPPIKLLLQIIIVCPSHWIFRIFLFKHDPQLLLTVPLKKKNSFELLSYYSWRFYQRHIWSYYSNSISREYNSNIFRREVWTWKS